MRDLASHLNDPIKLAEKLENFLQRGEAAQARLLNTPIRRTASLVVPNQSNAHFFLEELSKKCAEHPLFLDVLRKWAQTAPASLKG